MTDLEKRQIRDLRLNGVGYKAITSVLGLTRDAVRGYCKRNGLQEFKHFCEFLIFSKNNENYPKKDLENSIKIKIAT